MASSAPLWRGDESTQLQPGSPRRVTTLEGERIVLIYRGKYSTMLSARPTIGATVAGYADFYVDQVDLVPDGAGTAGPGTMTVILVSETWSGAETPDLDLTEEVEWTQLEKPIELHPRYRSGGASALDADDLDAIEEWRNATAAAERSTLYTALSTNAKELADKIRRGQVSYVVPAPLVRKTTKSFETPNSTAQGTRTATAPVSGAPSGYVWLGTGDRAVRQGGRGKWERVQEWTGADDWDSDLYAAS